MRANFETSIKVEVATISALTEQLMEFLHQAGVDARAAHHVALAAEELLTNLATHGGAPGAPATLRLAVAPDTVTTEIIDNGHPFDPRTAPAPDLSAGIMEREIGGIGLYLIRKLARSIDYARRDGANFTTFVIAREAL
jgi:anti-sigma regulatory factor (Ser/Thr protein kinase)